jgi:membrane protein DedA with SNARE-associated domain
VTAYLEQWVSWVGQHPVWAGLLIFFVAMAESLAVVGVLVPGVVVLFGIGALIGQGVLDFWTSCAWAAAGAVLGDNLSYWLGHHYEKRFAHLHWFDLHPEQLKKAEDFIHRHGGMSVAFGRFFGPLRAIVPLMAGLLRMAPSHFLIANVLSALVWAPAYLLPGMVFGASMDQATDVSARLAILILLLAALFFGLFKLLRFWIRSVAWRYILSAGLMLIPLLLLELGLSWHAHSLMDEHPSQPIDTTSLRAQGWHPLPPATAPDLLKLLSPEVPTRDLPPLFYTNSTEVYSRSKGDNERELLLVSDGQGWPLNQVIYDLWLMRLPVTRR